MIRFVSAAAAAAIALAPLTAAAASPSPSPSLDSIIVKPPSGFTELTSSPFHGEISASQYASLQKKSSQIEATLTHFGFVDAYGNTWVNATSRHALIEVVLAFTGGRGARNWLVAAEAGDKTDPTYASSDSISGIDPYYGEHVVDKTNNTIGDAFSFAKGNDVFLILVASGADDNLSLATSQTRAQYDAAPDSTIPSSQWPENANTNSAAFSAGAAFGSILVGVLILAVIAAVVGLIVRGRRRPTMPAYGGSGIAAPVVQMSPDGNYWYDGQGWRDASQEIPPTAQRSSDGTLWWDGRTWRPVAQPGQAPQAPTS